MPKTTLVNIAAGAGFTNVLANIASRFATIEEAASSTNTVPGLDVQYVNSTAPGGVQTFSATVTEQPGAQLEIGARTKNRQIGMPDQTAQGGPSATILCKIRATSQQATVVRLYEEE